MSRTSRWQHGVVAAVVAAALLSPADAFQQSASSSVDAPGVAAAPAARVEASKAAESVTRLRAGNARFVAHPEEALPITTVQRNALVKGQSPFASVLSCADSRVPPEVVFHVGLGDLFVVRAAGHVPDHAILASLEYAVEHLHSPLIVVMGHEACGAVKAAIETPPGTSLGVNLDYLVKAIRPSVTATATVTASADTRLRSAILENVAETINGLLEDSPILKHAATAGSVGFIGAYYELGTGRVHFSDMVAPPPGHK